MLPENSSTAPTMKTALLAVIGAIQPNSLRSLPRSSESFSRRACTSIAADSSAARASGTR